MTGTRQRQRSKCRIFADIIKVLESGHGEPVKVTHLLRSANVPYDRLIAYLAQMEKSGLVGRSGDGEASSFIVTHKGRKYLVEFRKLEEFGSVFGVEI